jgi:hypothetical protein
MNIYPSGFYVYAYIRLNGTPYYIGKGTNKRAWLKHYTQKSITTPPKNRIVILESNLTELGALALERRYIKWFGKKCDNTGILHNLTDGGEGVTGYKHTPETREKMKKPFHLKKTKAPKTKRTKNWVNIASSKEWIITFPCGKEEIITSLRNFCKFNNLHYTCMRDITYGRQKYHKGFSVKKVTG